LLTGTAAACLLLQVAWLGWAAAANGTVYLALGDSLTFGAGASDPATKGFVPLFRNFLESTDGLGTGLTLNDLFALTSADLLQQVVPQVRQQLQDGQVAVVTITTGGDDLFFSDIVPVCSGGVTPTCVETIQTTLATVADNLNQILAELRAAGGAALPIIVVTYPNSFKHPACGLHDLESLGNIVLEGNASLGLPQGFNDLVRSIAATHHVVVADLVPGGVFPDRLSPAELDSDCVHPNDAGYAIIAQAFISAFLNEAHCVASSSISSNFNGTPVAQGNSIWFNANVKATGLGSGTTQIFVRNASIPFTSNGTPYNVPVPDAVITFSPTATCATTSFNEATQRWETTVPLTGESVFLSGLAFPVPAGFQKGINPVIWQGTFSTDTPSVSLNWKWGAAVYTQFSTDYDALGVKPIEGNVACQYHNADHAGTPEHFKPFVTGGARGGGGSNFTGSWSGTKSVKPLCP